MRRFFVTAAAALFFITFEAAAHIANGGFETLENTGGNLVQTRSTAVVTGWQTIGGSQIQIARPGVNASLAGSAFGTSAAADGVQFAVLDPNITGVLYQTISAKAGDKLLWALSHKGRHGVGRMEVWIGSPQEIAAAAKQYVDGQNNVNRVDKALYQRIKQLWEDTDHPTPGCDREISTAHNVVTSNNGWVRYRGGYTVPAGQTETAIAFVSASGGNLLDAVDFGPVISAGAYRMTVRPSVGGYTAVRLNDQNFGSTASNNTVVVEPKEGDRVTITMHAADGETFSRGAVISRGDVLNGRLVSPYPGTVTSPNITSKTYTAGNIDFTGDMDITPVFARNSKVIIHPVGGTYTNGAEEITLGTAGAQYTLGAAERPGYRFTGWSVVGTYDFDWPDDPHADYRELWPTGATVQRNGDNLEINGTSIIHANQGFNLQAQYELIPALPLTVNINPNGGRYMGRPNPVQDDANAQVRIMLDAVNTSYTLSTPVWPGFTFTGWTVSGGGSPIPAAAPATINYNANFIEGIYTPTYTVGSDPSKSVLAEGITLTAQWSSRSPAALAFGYEYRYDVVDSCAIPPSTTSQTVQMPLMGGDTLHFRRQVFGYSPNELTQRITVTNAGNNTTGAITLSLTGLNASAFQLLDGDGLSAPNIGALAINAASTFILRPTANAVNAGTYTVLINVSVGGTLTTTIPVSLVVEKRRVSVSGITVNTKYFDGTDKGSINTDGAKIVDAISGDVITASAGELDLDAAGVTVKFSGRNAGEVDTNITIENIGLSGSAADNYIMTGFSAKLSAQILPRPITGVERSVAPVKTYNGDGVMGIGNYTFTYTLNDGEVSFTPPAGDDLRRGTDYDIELNFDPVTMDINGIARKNGYYVGKDLTYTYSVNFIDVTERTANYTLSASAFKYHDGEIAKAANFWVDYISVIVPTSYPASHPGVSGRTVAYNLTGGTYVDRLPLVFHQGASSGPRTYRSEGSAFNDPGEILTGAPNLGQLLADTTITFTGNNKISGQAELRFTIESHNYQDITAIIRFIATDKQLMTTAGHIDFTGIDVTYNGREHILEEAKLLAAGAPHGYGEDPFSFAYLTCRHNCSNNGLESGEVNDDEMSDEESGTNCATACTDDWWAPWCKVQSKRTDVWWRHVTTLAQNNGYVGLKRVPFYINRRTPQLAYLNYENIEKIYDEKTRHMIQPVLNTAYQTAEVGPFTGMGGITVWYDGSRVPPVNARPASYPVRFQVHLGANFTTANLYPDNAYIIHPKSLAGTENMAGGGTVATVSIAGSHLYDAGTAIVPDDEQVSVRLEGFNGGQPLVLGTDYDRTGMSNNFEVSANTVEQEAAVTITGIGNFKDDATGSFTIEKGIPCTTHFTFDKMLERNYNGLPLHGVSNIKIVNSQIGMGNIGTIRYAGWIFPDGPVDAAPYRVTVAIDEGENYLASPNLFLTTHIIRKIPPQFEHLRFRNTVTGDIVYGSAGLTAVAEAIIPTTDHIYNGLQQGLADWVVEENLPSPYAGIGAMTIQYNGSAVRPTNAGSYPVEVLVLEGRNFLKGTFPIGTYTIEKRSLSAAEVKIDSTYRYDAGAEIVPPARNVEVSLPDVIPYRLVPERDFTYTVTNNTEFGAVAVVTVTAAADGNYKDAAPIANFTIQKGVPRAGNFAITDPRTRIYNGLKQGIGVVATVDGVDGMGTLLEVTYDNLSELPVNVKGTGTAYQVRLIIADGGEKYEGGTVEFGTYTITRKVPALADLMFRLPNENEPDGYEYAEGPQLGPKIPTNHIFTGSAQGIVWDYAAQPVYPLTDMSGARTFRYEGLESLPVDAGTYTVTAHVTAGGNFNATAPAGLTLGTYTIAPKSLADAVVTIVDTTLAYDEGKVLSPEPKHVSVMLAGYNNGEPLVYDRDFTFTVANNTELGMAVITVTGKGNYDDDAQGEFEIVEGYPAASHFTFTIPAADIYNGLEQGIGGTSSITSSVIGMGEVAAVKYDGSTDLPVDAGTYEVTIDVAAGDNYLKRLGLPIGTYTIGKKTPVLSDLTFAEPESFINHIYDGSGQGIGSIGIKEPFTGMGVRSVLYEGSTDLPVDAGSYTVTVNVADDGDNFTSASGIAIGTYTIKKRPVTIINMAANNKVYDGGDEAEFNTGVADIDDIIEKDKTNLNVDGTDAYARFDNVNVGVDRTVSFYNFGLGGSAAGNYELLEQPESAPANITRRPLTVTPDDGQHKFYGDANPVLDYSSSNNVTGETPAFTGALSRISGENTGNYEIEAGTLALADNAPFLASNYTLEFSSSVVNFEVKKATHAAIPITRPAQFAYIGTRDYNISGYLSKLPGYILAEDILSYAAGTATGDNILAFSSVNAITGVVSYSLTAGLTIDDVDAGKKAVIPVTVSGFRNYNPITVNVTIELTGKTVVEFTGVSIADKAYDGEPVSLTGALVVRDEDTKIAVTDDPQQLVYTYTGTAPTVYNSADPPKDAGSYILEISTASGDPLYTGKSAPMPFTISKRTLIPSIDFTGVDGKVFDGEQDIEGTQPTITLEVSSGVPVPDESPAAVAAGGFVFVDANAGENKGVNASGIALTGSWGDNYELSAATLNNVPSGLVIERKNISIDDVVPPVKYYDKNLTAPTGTVDFTGEIAGHKLELNTDYTVSAVYTDNPNVGIGDKSYTYTVTMGITPKAKNYILTENTKDGTDGTINRMPILSIEFPTASPIINGETLANSILGTTASNEYGTFAWTSPEYAPALEESGNGFEVTFTPYDLDNYDWDAITFTSNVSVTVNTGLYLMFLNPSHDDSPIEDKAYGRLLTGQNRYTILVQVLRSNGEPFTDMAVDVTISFEKAGEKVEKVVSTDPATGVATYAVVIASWEDDNIPLEAWMYVTGGAVVKDFAVLEIRESALSVTKPGREILGPKDETTDAPVGLSSSITAGPNPVRKGLSAINLYRQGKLINGGTLTVYDVMGNAVSKINISDESLSSTGRRIVGSWDLTDSRGRTVPEGTYLIRGSVTTRDGNREVISIMVGVR